MSSITPARNPIAEPLARLIAVFEAHADALQFPDVNVSSLQADAAGVCDAAAEVERCERAVAEARDRLEANREALRARARRGLAYARIYAEDDPELSTQLEEIDLSPRRRAAAKKAPPKPGRRRRRGPAPATDADGVTELPFQPDQAERPVELSAAASA